jgi:pantoate--beta-alanine ligase
MSARERPPPRIVTTVRELRAEADAVRAAGGTVGFIGTSGNLHEGHLSLVRQMRAECDLGIMPFFLVPVPGLLEYGPGQGYERDFDKDRILAFDAGLDIAFEPTREDMYPRVPVQVRVVPDADLAQPWAGAENPPFMAMAATALTKYWNVVGPCRAYYGEKDWIPLTVLRRAIEDLSLNVTLVACPTRREADGLCASSRNAKLSPADRAAAPIVYRALSEAAALIESGERSPEAVRKHLREQISPYAALDYAEVVDAMTLRRVAPLRGNLRLLVSADFHGVHLFDNVGVELPP